MRSAPFGFCLGIVSLVIAAGTPAVALTCTGEPISARGEPASFEWLAKTKARANWRSRIRIAKNLGPTYSSWSKAEAKIEVCRRTPRGLICTFSAIPCRD